MKKLFYVQEDFSIKIPKLSKATVKKVKESLSNGYVTENVADGFGNDGMMVMDIPTPGAMSPSGYPVTSIMPEIEAIHVGVSRNNNRYTEYSLRGLGAANSGTSSWLTPFPKPILKNHDMETEPLGRAYQAFYRVGEKSGIACSVVVPKITDPDAIRKVLDERYMTVSVGLEADAAMCSICGKDWTENMCGHIRGQFYIGDDDEPVKENTRGAVKCVCELGNIFFRELSFVNDPSDENAMVITKNSCMRIEVMQYDDGTGTYDLIETKIGKVKSFYIPDQPIIKENTENMTTKYGDVEVASATIEKEESDSSSIIPENIEGNREEEMTTSISEDEYLAIEQLVGKFENHFESIESIEDLYLVALELSEMTNAEN